jgi:thioredoxin-like negative regulator of GroEL
MTEAGDVAEVTAATFPAEVLAAALPVVVDFYSTECAPCEALAPKFDALAEQFRGRARFLRVFRQGNRELAGQLGVSGSPTVLFFRGGAETGARLSGEIQRSELRQAIERLVG